MPSSMKRQESLLFIDATQYEVTLPADYDMNIIRNRVKARGSAFDAVDNVIQTKLLAFGDDGGVIAIARDGQTAENLTSTPRACTAPAPFKAEKSKSRIYKAEP